VFYFYFIYLFLCECACVVVVVVVGTRSHFFRNGFNGLLVLACLSF